MSSATTTTTPIRPKKKLIMDVNDPSSPQAKIAELELELVKKDAAMKDKIAALEIELVKKDAVIQWLSQKQHQIENQNQVQDPQSEADISARFLPTRYLPDPPIFEVDRDGDQSIDFDDWKAKIEMKLEADKYTGTMANAYVVSRVGSRAAIHIREKYGESVEEILGALQQVYGNPLQREHVEREYAALRQGEGFGMFETFWTDFKRLATALEKTEEEMLIDLKEKSNKHTKKYFSRYEVAPGWDNVRELAMMVLHKDGEKAKETAF